MQTIPISVYRYDELGETARQRAKDHFREVFGYSWADEALASLKALAEHFGGKVADYEIDWFNGSYSSATFAMPELEPEEIESRLAKLGTFNHETLKGNGDCVLTGVFCDEDAIDGFRQAWHKGERDLDKLMQAAFETWIQAAHAVDCASQYEDEQFSETCEANDYWFFEDGKLIPRKLADSLRQPAAA